MNLRENGYRLQGDDEMSTLNSGNENLHEGSLVGNLVDEMTVFELRECLRAHERPVSGRKADLIARVKSLQFSDNYHENPNFATLMGEVDRCLPDYPWWKENDHMMDVLNRLMGGQSLDHSDVTYIGMIWHPDVHEHLEQVYREQKWHDSKARQNSGTETGVSFSDVKGLQPLVDWASKAGKLFTPAAREYGFPRYPNGVLLTGVPGCGKTMIAKAIAQEWGMGFRRVFPDQLVGSCIGDNEKFMRELCDELSKNAPIVCFIDEAEKILGQTRSPTFYRVSDASRDSAESILLQFMEEDDSGVFFVFTSNNFEQMSPALIDRFEERFFIDFPTQDAREEMISSMLVERKRDPSKFDVKMLAEVAEEFTGRDIRSAVDEAMKNAFCDDGREFTTEDLMQAFEQTNSTSTIHKKEILKLRRMVAGGKMRRANATMEKPVEKIGKNDSFVGWN